MHSLNHSFNFINYPCKSVNHPSKLPNNLSNIYYYNGILWSLQGEFGKSEVLITKSTDARGILNPQSVIPRAPGGLG